MNKKIAVALATCFLTVSAASFTACGDTNKHLGNVEKGDRTEITFLCINNSTSLPAWQELVASYNDGQGLEDNVFVNLDINGSVSPSDTVFKRSKESAANVVALGDGQDGFQKLLNLKDSRRAPDGLFLDLSDYAANDEDFKKNTISQDLLNWWSVTVNTNAKQGAGEAKHIIGAGQHLMGVPYATNAHFNWYNEAIFKAQGINIISVPEEELDDYNTEHGTNFKPHGYAEYKADGGAQAPASGLTKSKNLAGKEVYKVFNNCIGMNWEEQRNILKYFNTSFNDGNVTGTAATTQYGFVSEYWFNYGWSVGGDVMGYNGTEYDFTLLDKNPNYIVTKDETIINGVTYNAGEIVRYEDRVNGIEKAAIKPADVYAINSTYDAIKEYVSLQVGTKTTVDTVGSVTYKGYGVGSPDTTSGDNWFNTAQIAMVRGVPDGIKSKLSRTNAADFNICMPETYREYEGGSVYSTGNGFENEYLKVIGETYGDEVYTGDIKVVGDAKIIGNTSTASISQGLVIPACSDPEKYQSAWDFISWVATDGQKYVAKTQTVAPAAGATLFSEDYAYNTELTQGKNFYAVAKTALSAGRGDWGYFENGEWVYAWSSDFNNKVRKGLMTLSNFNTAHAAEGKRDLNNMYSIIKGIR